MLATLKQVKAEGDLPDAEVLRSGLRFTASPALGRDANRLFNFMTGYGKPYDLELVSVAPVTLRARLEELIRTEIANARAGLPSGIWVKVNALVDVKMPAGGGPRSRTW